MADVFYPGTLAADPGTVGRSPLPNAVFQVYELTDTAQVNPLPLKDSSGLSITALTSTSLGVLPPVYVTSPNLSHNWVSGTWVWRRDSFDGAQAAVTAAKNASISGASLSPTGDLTFTTLGGNVIPAGNVKGPQGNPGANSVPTQAAIQSEVTTPGTPTDAALKSTYAQQWKPATAYDAGQPVVNPTGDVVTAKAAFTSGASYNPANWNYSPTYSTPASVTADIQSPVGQIRGALDYRYARRGGPVTSGIALMFDDLIKNQYVDGMPYVENVGGRVTFAAWTDRIGAAGCMTSADMVAAAARGHEFANHSKQHIGVAGMTPTDRATEYANAQAVLDGILGAGKVTSLVYPQNSNNVVTDRENFLRFDRVFTGGNASFIRPMSDRNMFLKGRWGWNSTNHQATLGLIRAIASSNSIIALYTHTIDGTDAAQGVTLAQFKELVDLATALGVPFLTASEAFPADHAIPDAGFESPTLLDNWNVTVNADGSAASVVDTPDAGYPGARSMKLVNGGASATAQVITSKVTIPLLNPALEHTFSCRFRQTVTSGTGGTQLTLRQYDQYNNVLVVSTIPVDTTTTGWVQKALAFTPHALATHVRPGFNQTQFVGEAYLDHCHFGPTRNGVYG